MADETPNGRDQLAAVDNAAAPARRRLSRDECVRVYAGAGLRPQIEEILPRLERPNQPARFKDAAATFRQLLDVDLAALALDEALFDTVRAYFTLVWGQLAEFERRVGLRSPQPPRRGLTRVLRRRGWLPRRGPVAGVRRRLAMPRPRASRRDRRRACRGPSASSDDGPGEPPPHLVRRHAGRRRPA